MMVAEKHFPTVCLLTVCVSQRLKCGTELQNVAVDKLSLFSILSHDYTSDTQCVG